MYNMLRFSYLLFKYKQPRTTFFYHLFMNQLMKILNVQV